MLKEELNKKPAEEGDKQAPEDKSGSACREELVNTAAAAELGDQLKGELLRDIVDRLNQKLALIVLRINARVKREMYI